MTAASVIKLHRNGRVAQFSMEENPLITKMVKGSRGEITRMMILMV